MAVDGVYDAWPIDRKVPRLRAKTGALYGRVIDADELLALDPADAMQLLRDRVETLRLDLRARLRRNTHGRHPIDQAGDVRSL